MLRRHDEAHESLAPARLERIFIYAAVWGLGGLLDVKDRAALDAEMRTFGSNMPPRQAPWGIGVFEDKKPSLVNPRAVGRTG
jgi:ABC-type transporter lipoprotein component MlaA